MVNFPVTMFAVAGTILPFDSSPLPAMGAAMTDLHLDPALREPAQTSKAWPFEEARKLVKRYPEGKPGGEAVLFETCYGPSGLPHIGTFNEVLRTTMVRRAYEQMTGAPTRLVAVSHRLDGPRQGSPTH